MINRDLKGCQGKPGTMTKIVVTIVGSDGEQTKSVAAKVEGLARPKRSSREPKVVGGEDV
jgi:hypothetical protein